MRYLRRSFHGCTWTAAVGHVATFALVLVCCATFTRAQPQPGQYLAYPLRSKKVEDVEQQLASMLRHLGPVTHVVADRRGNQVLLRGPESAHQIARQFIESIDQPPVRQLTSPSVVRGYPCPPGWLEETAVRLQSRYGTYGNVRVSTDPGTSQVIVLAPPEIHALIAKEVAGMRANSMPAQPRPNAGSRAPPAEQLVALTHVPLTRMEPQLRQLLGARLEPLPGRGAGRPDYLFVDAASRRVEMTCDYSRNGIHLVGPGSLVMQLARLILAMDSLYSPQQEPSNTVRIIPVYRADPTKVREAVDAYRSGSMTSPGTPPSTPMATPPGQRTGRNVRPGRSIALTQHTALPPGDNAAVAPAEATPIPTGGEELQQDQEQQDRLRELGDNVEIETLPDLDVIILRGPDRDIDEVSRIIAELERLSAETVPVIDIYRLRYVNGLSLVTIIDLIAEDLIGGRQGKIHVTPLVKPNAILLVGWGEAVEAMKELIAKLDQPVSPHTQMRVYRLRHAPAASASQVIEDTFGDSQGLGARVEVTVDGRTNSLIVRAGPRDLAEVDLLINRIDQGTSGAVNQARIFKLNNALANDLAATLQSAITAAAGGPGDQKSTALEFLTADVKGQRILKSGILSDVQITPDPHTNTLVITAPAESMELLAAVIEQLDSPTAVAQIKVFKVVNGDANTLIEMLRTLLPSQVGVPGPQLAGAEGETTLVPVRFSVDSRTNSIIATGSQGDLTIIEALLLRLDAEEIEERESTVYRLKNSPAVEVALSINEFLRSQRTLEQAAPGVVSPFEQIEREVVVVPEPVSNSLIISATPRYFQDIIQLVEDLDSQPPQVMIQVMIAEVELRDVDEFGVELGLQDSVLFDRSLLGALETITQSNVLSTDQGIVTVTEDVIASATNDPGFDFNNNPLGNSGATSALRRSGAVGGQGLSHFSLGRVSSDLDYGGLVLSASSDSVSVLIRALQESRRLEVLARPQIMTLDNQSAFIQVGKRVPRITGVRFDARVQTNTVELENTGLILGVTPRISPEGMVVMEIDAEKSKLGPEQEGVPISVAEGAVVRSPSIDVTMAQTTVSASSGETIILGGLITKSTRIIKRRVPLLADIPILGALFRFDSDECLRTELLIFLTPHVVKSSQDSDRIKQLEAARMSWCLGDVHAIHGPTGLFEDGDTSDWHGQGEVIYPDTNHQGLVPGEFSPREVPLEKLELSPPIEQLPAPTPIPAKDGVQEPAGPLGLPGGGADAASPAVREGPPPAENGSPSAPQLNRSPPIDQSGLTLPSRSNFAQRLRPAYHSVPLGPPNPAGSVQFPQPSGLDQRAVVGQADRSRTPYQ